MRQCDVFQHEIYWGVYEEVLCPHCLAEKHLSVTLASGYADNIMVKSSGFKTYQRLFHRKINKKCWYPTKENGKSHIHFPGFFWVAASYCCSPYLFLFRCLLDIRVSGKGNRRKGQHWEADIVELASGLSDTCCHEPDENH